MTALGSNVCRNYCRALTVALHVSYRRISVVVAFQLLQRANSGVATPTELMAVGVLTDLKKMFGSDDGGGIEVAVMM